jgi:hypothetical protein
LQPSASNLGPTRAVVDHCEYALMLKVFSNKILYRVDLVSGMIHVTYLRGLGYISHFADFKEDATGDSVRRD